MVSSFFSGIINTKRNTQHNNTAHPDKSPRAVTIGSELRPPFLGDLGAIAVFAYTQTNQSLWGNAPSFEKPGVKPPSYYKVKKAEY